MSKINEKKYLKNPDECPFCGSSDISGDYGEFSGTGATRDISCKDCDGQWYESFKMTGITEL